LNSGLTKETFGYLSINTEGLKIFMRVAEARYETEMLEIKSNQN